MAGVDRVRIQQLHRQTLASRAGENLLEHQRQRFGRRDRLVAELEFAGGHAWIVLDGEIAVPTTAVSRISTTCRTSSPGTSGLEPE
jgi:hypothetical protein